MKVTPMDLQAPRLIRVPWKAAAIARLRLWNRTSSAEVTGSAPVSVSLTSYGDRLKTAWLAIESIAQGSIRPRRMILWVDEDDFDVENYPELARLQGRGLEILRCEGLGPHNKYYPYIRMTAANEIPTVTADDDVLYPQGWLDRLCEGHVRHPEDLVALRCHRWTLTEGGTAVAPYARWSAPEHYEASFANFMTGVGGAILPIRLQQRILRDGTEFTASCPRADDIWINVEAIRAGVKVRCIPAQGLRYISIPGLQQKSSLHSFNVAENGNDAQIRATITPEDLRVLEADAPVIELSTP